MLFRMEGGGLFGCIPVLPQVPKVQFHTYSYLHKHPPLAGGPGQMWHKGELLGSRLLPAAEWNSRRGPSGSTERPHERCFSVSGSLFDLSLVAGLSLGPNSRIYLHSEKRHHADY